VTNGQHFDLYVDVKTQELKQYATAPTGVTWRTQTYDASVIPAGHPTWRTAAQLFDGSWLYVDQTSTSVIRRLAVDSTGATVETVVYNGTFAIDGNCTLIMVVSN
jgi:hypothetical protein